MGASDRRGRWCLQKQQEGNKGIPAETEARERRRKEWMAKRPENEQERQLQRDERNENSIERRRPANRNHKKMSRAGQKARMASVEQNDDRKADSAKHCSYFTKMGRIGKHSSRETAADCSGSTKAYSLVNSQELRDESRSAHPSELLVLRDMQWWYERLSSFSDEQTGEQYFDKITGSLSGMLDVQDLSLESLDSAVNIENANEFQHRRRRASDGQITSKPLSLPNVSSKQSAFMPPSLVVYCDLLSKASQQAEDEIRGILRAKRPTKSYSAAVDIEGCL